jgi:2-polyprenyl-3-methyl-5-hydroxy-6-metoxy-1,4-benzoquinol methylase
MKQEEIFREKKVSPVRDYWNARSRNIRHSPHAAGTREFFSGMEARQYIDQPHISAFAGFPRRARKRVLETGRGIEIDTINFARAGARVAAVDLSEKPLEPARRFGWHLCVSAQPEAA